jgi:hypothetical protein
MLLGLAPYRRTPVRSHCHRPGGDLMRRGYRYLLMLATLALSAPVWASAPVAIPEPGVVDLLGAGAIAAGLIWLRNRRK